VKIEAGATRPLLNGSRGVRWSHSRQADGCA
jgi:hypothetical protein